MALHIYSLTEIGHSLARSTSAPSDPKGMKNYQVISWLDKKGRETGDGIALHTGVKGGDLGVVLRRLRVAGVIKEDSITSLSTIA